MPAPSLLDLPKILNMKWGPFHGFTNEDGYIWVNMRHIFEEHGCTFAPLELAIEFSQETPIPEAKGVIPFTFHKYEGKNSAYPDFEIPHKSKFFLFKENMKSKIKSLHRKIYSYRYKK